MCEKKFTTLLTNYNASYKDEYADKWGSLVPFIEGGDSYQKEARAVRYVTSLYNSIESPKAFSIRGPTQKHRPSQSTIYSHPASFKAKPHVRTFRNQSVISSQNFISNIDRSMSSHNIATSPNSIYEGR
jgi:hypothetical protein